MKKLIALLSVLLALSGIMIFALMGPVLGGDDSVESEPAVAQENPRSPAVVSPGRQQTKNAEIRRIIRQETEE